MAQQGEWRSRAVCREVDPELFFPVSDRGGAHDAQVAAAKAVCARCPVRRECLSEALERLPHGVAGGLTAAERRALRRRAEAGSAERGTGGRCRRLDRDRSSGVQRLLEAGWSPQDAAARCGVSERTAYRYASRMSAPATSAGVGS